MYDYSTNHLSNWSWILFLVVPLPGKYDAIYDLLAEMNVPERSSATFDWAIGGQIIFDFIWLRKNLDSGT